MDKQYCGYNKVTFTESTEPPKTDDDTQSVIQLMNVY